MPPAIKITILTTKWGWAWGGGSTPFPGK